MLEELEDELKYYSYLTDHASLMLNIGLFVNFVKATKEYKEKLKISKDNYNLINEKIKILNEQISYGVDIKGGNK